MISTIIASLIAALGTWLAITSNTDPDQLVVGLFFAAIGFVWLIIKQIIKTVKAARKEA